MDEGVIRQFDLGESCAVVTGGGTGIGKTIALGLARSGARVAVWGRRRAPLRETVRQICEEGGLAAYVVADITKNAAVKQAFAKTKEQFGDVVNILINCAGVHLKVAAIEMAEEDLQRVFDVNLKSAFLTSQHFVRQLKGKRPGCIVNIASMTTFVGLAGTAAYGASKGAVGQLTRSLAVEWAPLGIRVNAIAPGFFVTDINRTILVGTARGAKILARTPMGRFGNLDELTSSVIYLCSPGASFVTGVILPVDGGFLANGL